MFFQRLSRMSYLAAGILCLAGGALAQQTSSSAPTTSTKPATSTPAKQGAASTWGFPQQAGASTFGVSGSKPVSEKTSSPSPSTAAPGHIAEANTTQTSSTARPSSSAVSSAQSSSVKAGATSNHSAMAGKTKAPNPFTPALVPSADSKTEHHAGFAPSGTGFSSGGSRSSASSASPGLSTVPGSGLNSGLPQRDARKLKKKKSAKTKHLGLPDGKPANGLERH